MTKDEAIALYHSGFWESMTAYDRALFQLSEPLLCMPFDVFHASVEEALGRPVWTHEFAGRAGMERLRKELLGERAAPSMAEIINLIPADKRIILVI